MKKAIQVHFNRLASSYDEEVSWRQDPELLQSFRAEIPPRFDRALDLGCGTGIIAQMLDRGMVVGIDISEAMCLESRQRGIMTVCTDISAIPFRRGEFDLILGRQVLQYVRPDSLGDVIKQVTAVSRPGATLVLHHFTVPPGAPAAWWRTVKAHTQPLRKAILTIAALHQSIAPHGWQLLGLSKQSHPRTWDLVSPSFQPSLDFPSPASLGVWIQRTGPREAPSSLPAMNGTVFSFLQEWALLLYRLGG